MSSDVRDRSPIQHKPQAQALPEADLRLRLRALAHELTMAEARERHRIAQVLHDDIGQLLAVARFKIQELQQCPPQEQAAQFSELQALLEQASRATRSVTFDLSSPALDQGLDDAFRVLAQRLSRSGEAQFQVEGRMPDWGCSQPVLAVLYRVARELAANAQRHAHAHQVWIRIEHDAHRLLISVSDDGVGIDPTWMHRGLSREGGFGLVNAQAQMLALGGGLQVESGPGSGTLATLTLPVEQACAP